MSEPRIHILPGRKGVERVHEQNGILAVVDVLCASSTLTAFFACGGKEAHVVETAEKAFSWKEKLKESLLAGEKFARPIPGFDLGFTPLDMEKHNLSGKSIVFTSTNGALIMIEAAQEVSEVFVGAITNARAVAAVVTERAKRSGRDVVIVPAGIVYSDESTMQWEVEDWAGACRIASYCDLEIHPESMEPYTAMCERIQSEGFTHILNETPLGNMMIQFGLEEVVRYCATEGRTDIVPSVEEVLRDAECGIALRLTAYKGGRL